MNRKTAKALEGSIEKWRKIAEEGGEDRFGSNCPLCYLFVDAILFGEPPCVGCPVMRATGVNSCANSPHEAWVRHQDKIHLEKSEYKVFCPTCTRLARKEQKFLEGLRE